MGVAWRTPLFFEMLRFAVLDLPSNLGLRPSGVERLPEALRRAGLLERLRARDADASSLPRRTTGGAIPGRDS